MPIFSFGDAFSSFSASSSPSFRASHLSAEFADKIFASFLFPSKFPLDPGLFPSSPLFLRLLLSSTLIRYPVLRPTPSSTPARPHLTRFLLSRPAASLHAPLSRHGRSRITRISTKLMNNFENFCEILASVKPKLHEITLLRSRAQPRGLGRAALGILFGERFSASAAFPFQLPDELTGTECLSDMHA